ncbi:MAG: preprotein translocase subunit SecA [Candidatus Sumerlaeia bacterium]|nr:preprotein translocase subunit SecA [Candidatus Sumerlaeia bacterium]
MSDSLISKIFGFVLGKILGSKQQRDIKRLMPIVAQINQWYEKYDSLSDDELKAKTDEFRRRYKEGETLDQLLPEAYAVVKQACKRHVGQRWVAGGTEIEWIEVPYDVQLMGGIVLHQGKIAEMATGEGKTLVAILPLYLNALPGRGAHLVTVNDYLAKRDSEWTGHILQWLGLTVGCIDKTEPNTPERRAMYHCDVTYGTNNEFGFDYLRDNMAVHKDQLVQREHYYAIVDEVDNILIDEARTPLIISGPVDRSTHRFDKMKPLVHELVRKQTFLVNRLLNEAEQLLQSENGREEAGVKLLLALKGAPKNKRLMKLRQDGEIQRLTDKTEAYFMAEKKLVELLESELLYHIDEKSHEATLTEKGREALRPDNPESLVPMDLTERYAEIEATPGLSEEEKEKRKAAVNEENEIKREEIHNISQLLRAYALFEKDVDYVVQDNKVIIVDEFTGRLMPGRRYSDGLHQALEAKEGVTIEIENQTLATITLQNYFRMYKKLAGMTGTAETEAAEFAHTYKMDVVVIPTHKPCRRIDYDDVVYRTRREKYNAILDEIVHLHQMKLPVLVGTISVEVSETLSRMLKRRGISHNVLNAKNHAREAEIIRDAGTPGTVTIATNMAGRGTDIKLKPGILAETNERNEEGDILCKSPDGEDVIPYGLQVIGSERHEARRIDRQLRGRSGRQGDPGTSRFFISLEDDLMRLFAQEWMHKIMRWAGMKEGEEIQHPMVTRAITRAQRKIEAINFERRKRTLEYDNVMNKQREFIYGLRRQVLVHVDAARVLTNDALCAERLGCSREQLFKDPILRARLEELGLWEVLQSDDEDELAALAENPRYREAFHDEILGEILEPLKLRTLILDLCENAAAQEFEKYGKPKQPPHEWDLNGFFGYLRRVIPYINLSNPPAVEELDYDRLLDFVRERLGQAYDIKVRLMGGYLLSNHLSRMVVLHTIDQNWRDHLLGIEELRESVWMQSYAQQDPLVVYQKEASLMLEELRYNIHKQVLEHFYTESLVSQDPRIQRQMEYHKQMLDQMAMDEEMARRMAAGEIDGEAPAAKPMPVRRGPKVGRNEPCPCGSGKKYKKCCGAATARAAASESDEQ